MDPVVSVVGGESLDRVVGEALDLLGGF